MQEKLTIARPYASAAFSHAVEHECVNDWSTMLGVLAGAVTDSALSRLIAHPKITGEQIIDLMTEILGDRVTGESQNFIRTLVDAERLELAPQISELFEKRRQEAVGLVTVEVASAFPLTDIEEKKMSDAMSKKLGKSCKLESFVDEELIGGAVVKVGDSVTDLSIRRRLSDLGQELI